MERLKRCSKKVTFAFVLAFVVSVTGVFSTSFNSKAQSVSNTNEFFVGYAEPTTDSNSGYVSILLKDSTGKYILNTYFWSFWSASGIDNNPNGLITMRVVCSGNVVKFEPIFHGGYLDYYHWQFANYDANESLNFKRYGSYANTQTSDLSYSYDASPQYSVVGCVYGGNVSYIKGFGSITPIIHWSDSVSALELRNTLSQIFNQLVDLELDLHTITNKIADIYNQNITIQQKIDQLISLQNQILAQEKESNTWLEKIWNSIQEFIAPDSSDKGKTDGLKNDSDNQSNEINDLNEQSKTEKVDIDSASGNVDAYIDGDAIRNYGTLLSVFTNHEYILQCILVVLAIGLVAYVLFGKKR